MTLTEIEPIIRDLESIYENYHAERDQLPDATTPSYWLLTGKTEGINNVIQALKLKQVRLQLAREGKLR